MKHLGNPSLVTVEASVMGFVPWGKWCRVIPTAIGLGCRDIQLQF